ncbi:hypothetical protein GCM10028827_07810 [Mucilaginibacter myungsuensis]
MAQTTDVPTLTREGNELSTQKNYPAALEKYKAALAIAPEYAPANYQMAFTLNASGKGLEALPYLEKVFKSTEASANLINGAYSLAGSIYDRNRQPQKAIESYKQGIAANPTNQPLQYNLALAYFRNKQYTDAETTAEQAIKLDPKHASTMRVHGLVTFHQNERAVALLSFCSFLILEPNTLRSTEAINNIRSIFHGGILKREAGAKPIRLDANTIALNNAVTIAIKPFATRRYASAGDLLAAQLTAVFTSIGQIAEKQNGNDFFRKYQAAYFYQLAKSPHMPPFARYITQTTPGSAKWIAANAQAMTDLDVWLKGTERGF